MPTRPPEAFRLDPATGRYGVIDWSYALRGPLLDDLASAVMYATPDRVGPVWTASYGGPPRTDKEGHGPTARTLGL